jgi:transposase
MGTITLCSLTMYPTLELRETLLALLFAVSPPTFAEVEIASAQSDRADPEPSSPDVLSRPPGLIEILLPTNVTLRVDAQVDGSALRRVLAALAGR